MAGTEINALTLRVSDMNASLRFYRDLIGLTVEFGGDEEPFSTVRFGDNYINLTCERPDEPIVTGWGRAVLHHPDPDSLWALLTHVGWSTETSPADAPWGERYFHVRDPDGHELSFARRL